LASTDIIGVALLGTRTIVIVTHIAIFAGISRIGTVTINTDSATTTITVSGAIRGAGVGNTGPSPIALAATDITAFSTMGTGIRRRIVLHGSFDEFTEAISGTIVQSIKAGFAGVRTRLTTTDTFNTSI
jgi:hypothetical protein